jgi:ribosomal protein RSM22 (predicted rRNA methylase)
MVWGVCSNEEYSRETEYIERDLPSHFNAKLLRRKAFFSVNDFREKFEYGEHLGNSCPHRIICDMQTRTTPEGKIYLASSQ